MNKFVYFTEFNTPSYKLQTSVVAWEEKSLFLLARVVFVYSNQTFWIAS